MGTPGLYAWRDSVTITETIVGGAACNHSYMPLPGSSMQLTGASIVNQPSHGSLVQSGGLKFTYRPENGFTGSDRYSINVCGNGSHGSGCSHLTYQITVE